MWKVRHQAQGVKMGHNVYIFMTGRGEERRECMWTEGVDEGREGVEKGRREWRREGGSG